MQLPNFSHPLLQQRTISAWQTNCNNFLTYGKDNILSRLKMFFLFRGTHGVIIVYDVSAGESFANVKRWLHEIDQVIMLFRCESISITINQAILSLNPSLTSSLISSLVRHISTLKHGYLSSCLLDKSI